MPVLLARTMIYEVSAAREPRRRAVPETAVLGLPPLALRLSWRPAEVPQFSAALAPGRLVGLRRSYWAA